MTFADRVYAVVRQIPRGQVSTYGDVARALGTRAYQAVGIALRNNPYAPEVPCHRVVRRDGSLGGFRGSLSGAPVREKRLLLESEGVLFDGDRVAEECFFSFTRSK